MSEQRHVLHATFHESPGLYFPPSHVTAGAGSVDSRAAAVGLRGDLASVAGVGGLAVSLGAIAVGSSIGRFESLIGAAVAGSLSWGVSWLGGVAGARSVSMAELGVSTGEELGSVASQAPPLSSKEAASAASRLAAARFETRGVFIDSDPTRSAMRTLNSRGAAMPAPTAIVADLEYLHARRMRRVRSAEMTKRRELCSSVIDIA